MKKIFKQPELMVVRFNKNICTDIIAVSNREVNSSDITILAPDRLYPSNDWDAGY